VTSLLQHLRLSIPELDLIARAADLAAFPGLPTDVAEPASDGLLIDGLRARGILLDDGDDLKLDEEVSALLGAVLASDVSLQLETTVAAGAFRVVIHLQDQVAFLQQAVDGLVLLTVVPQEHLQALLLALCSEDASPSSTDVMAPGVIVTPDEMLAAESGAGAPELSGYIASSAAPERAGRAAARGTLYGEMRAACAWLAGPGGTFVVYDRASEMEIVRADGRSLAARLLALTGLSH
jgi:hypothetical protein